MLLARDSKGPRGLLLSCALAGFGALAAAPASAQTYVCTGGPGPGEVQIGVQNDPGFNGAPVCAPDPHASGYDDDYDGGYGGFSGGDDGPRPDPAARALQAMIEVERLIAQREIDRAALERDSRYLRYSAGSWEYFQDPGAKGPGESCVAFFTRGRGFVAVTTPARGSPNAYLTFWSPEIPKPRESVLVRASLAQSGGDPPQMVTAINSFDPASGMGAVILAVPDLAALLGNMLDVHQFSLSMEGRAVAHVEWTGGLAARDRLRACAAGGG